MHSGVLKTQTFPSCIHCFDEGILFFCRELQSIGGELQGGGSRLDCCDAVRWCQRRCGIVRSRSGRPRGCGGGSGCPGFRWACAREVSLLAALETSTFLSVFLLLRFCCCFAHGCACIHCVWVARGQLRAWPPPAAAVARIAAAAAAVVVPLLCGCEYVAQRLLAHPITVLPLRAVFPFFEGVGGVYIDDGFRERARKS